MIEALFPEAVVTIVATPEMWDGRLYPEEEVCVTRAVAKRRREFTAGRLCAKRALERLGITHYPLLVDDHRAPVWPSDTVGSISHCEGYCAAAVARRQDLLAIGFDVERAGSLPPELAVLVCTPAEVARLAALSRDVAGKWAKLAFSAKESVYKCYHPLVRHFLEFHDVDVTFTPRRGTFSATILPTAPALPTGERTLHGRFSGNATYVATAITLAAPPG